MDVGAAGAAWTAAGVMTGTAASGAGSGAGTTAPAAAWSAAMARANGGGAAAASGATASATAEGGGRTRAVKDKGVPKGKSAKKKARRAAARAYARQTPEQRRQTTDSVRAMYRELVGREASAAESDAAHRSLSRGLTLDELRDELQAGQEATHLALDKLLAAAQADGGERADPERVALIREARVAVDEMFAAQSGGDRRVASLAGTKARLKLAQATRPQATRHADKMLAAAQRLVDAGERAKASGRLKRVQEKQTAADLCLDVAATPEADRVRASRSYVDGKGVKHTITVDPASADPAASYKHKKKRPSVFDRLVKPVVGAVLTVASFIPGVNAVAIPAAVAWNVAMAAKSIAEGDIIAGAIGLVGAVGAGAGAGLLTRVAGFAQGAYGAVQGIRHGDVLGGVASAAGGLASAAGPSTQAGRLLAAGSGALGAASAASRGDWTGALSGASWAVSSATAAGGDLGGEWDTVLRVGGQAVGAITSAARGDWAGAAASAAGGLAGVVGTGTDAGRALMAGSGALGAVSAASRGDALGAAASAAAGLGFAVGVDTRAGRALYHGGRAAEAASRGDWTGAASSAAYGLAAAAGEGTQAGVALRAGAGALEAAGLSGRDVGGSAALDAAGLAAASAMADTLSGASWGTSSDGSRESRADGASSPGQSRGGTGWNGTGWGEAEWGRTIRGGTGAAAPWEAIGSEAAGSEAPRFDTGGESTPAAVVTPPRVASGAAPGAAGAGGAGSGWFDAGGESAPAVAVTPSRASAADTRAAETRAADTGAGDRWGGWGEPNWGGALFASARGGASDTAAWDTRETGGEAASAGSGWAARAIAGGMERARGRDTGADVPVAQAGAARTMGDATGLPGLEHIGADGTPLADTDGSTARAIRQFVSGVGRGVAEGVVGTAQGAWDVATTARRFVTDRGFQDPVAGDMERLARRGSAALAYALDDPSGAAGAAARGVTGGARDLYERYEVARSRAEANGTLPELYGRLLGRGAYEAGTAVLPGVAAGEAAGATGKAAEATTATGRALEGVDRAGDAIKGTQATGALHLASASEQGGVTVRLGQAGEGAGTAAKLSFDRGLDPGSRLFGIQAGRIVAQDPIASAHYARLQAQGTDVRFINDPTKAEWGLFDPNRNTVTINLAKHTSAEEVASTIVHEATYQHRKSIGTSLGTQYEEYLAFRNESYFKLGQRPSLNERHSIWNDIQELHPELPQGNHPFGGNR